MTRVTKLTHETLLAALDYDPATGVFSWKVARSNRVKAGSRAGVVHAASGGRYISIGGEKFMAHRLAWFYVNGEMPSDDIRPIDGNYDNCAIDNLRPVTRVDLAHGRQKVATNTSGYNGVSAGRPGKWQAKITWNYRRINLGGSFDTPEDAGRTVEDAYVVLKATSTQDEVDAAIAGIRLNVRRRSAWKNMVRSFKEHGWDSFEHFAGSITDIPARRFALAPIDPMKPIGPFNFDLHRDRDFRKKYGISFAEYSEMLEDQKGVCAICEKPEIKLQHGAVRLLSVDHDHVTGAVRGLLCGNCNMALGYACDDVSILEKGIAYLRKHSKLDTSGFSPDRDWLFVGSPGFVN